MSVKVGNVAIPKMLTLNVNLWNNGVKRISWEPYGPGTNEFYQPIFHLQGETISKIELLAMSIQIHLLLFTMKSNMIWVSLNHLAAKAISFGSRSRPSKISIVVCAGHTVPAAMHPAVADTADKHLELTSKN